MQKLKTIYKIMAKKKQVFRKSDSSDEDIIEIGGLCLKNEIDFGFSTGTIRSVKPNMAERTRAMLERDRNQKKKK